MLTSTNTHTQTHKLELKVTCSVAVSFLLTVGEISPARGVMMAAISQTSEHKVHILVSLHSHCFLLQAAAASHNIDALSKAAVLVSIIQISV